jgi:hypothetical protein
MTIRCGKCQSALAGGMRFCPGCGQRRKSLEGFAIAVGCAMFFLILIRVAATVDHPPQRVLVQPNPAPHDTTPVSNTTPVVRDDAKMQELMNRLGVVPKSGGVVDESQPLQLIGSTFTTDAAGVVHIEGKVRNNTAKTYSYVQITFDVYNNVDDKAGNAVANVAGLAPGQTWAFDAISFAKGADRFTLRNVTGF